MRRREKCRKRSPRILRRNKRDNEGMTRDANLVVVHEFSSSHEAEIARGALQASGIDAMIQADTIGGMRPHVAWAGGGFKLLVREEDVEIARDVLLLPEGRDGRSDE